MEAPSENVPSVGVVAVGLRAGVGQLVQAQCGAGQ